TGENFAAAVREIVDDAELRARKINCAVATARKNTREASTELLFETYDRIYQDFHSRRELFADKNASAHFDFARELIK
ncbi:MAG TPA: hypothetical protein VEV84_14500, partial [Pyrinomonadaceae bacterium]|nr:hypothetical protein [Pyrinomonadaceae bacterium]